MCLIMTICAALLFTLFFALAKKNNRNTKSFLTTSLMFWAASLMWSVDGIASVLEGERFFDISKEDTILGAIIIAAGLLVFFAMYTRELLLKRKVSK